MFGRYTIEVNHFLNSFWLNKEMNDSFKIQSRAKLRNRKFFDNLNVLYCVVQHGSHQLHVVVKSLKHI